MSSLPTLNIIGAGKVAQTLARLLLRRGVVTAGDVVNRSMGSARCAAQFIGGGTARGGVAECGPAEVWLIGVKDGEIAGAAQALVRPGKLREGDIVFHLSGAIPSSVIEWRSAASVHPVMTFPKAITDEEALRGTPVLGEGETQALKVLRPWFEGIGMKWHEVPGLEKSLYHCGTAIVSNGLVALLDLGLAAVAKSGVGEKDAPDIVEHLARQTVDGVFRSGAVDSLTGPVARGDAGTLRKHVEAISQFGEPYVTAYRSVALMMVELAVKRGELGEEVIGEMRKVLCS